MESGNGLESIIKLEPEEFQNRSIQNVEKMNFSVEKMNVKVYE